MTRPLAYALAVGAALIAGWLVPALTIRGLAPALSASPLVTKNYRGRAVFLGLGMVWAIWSVSLFVMSAIVDAVAEFVEAPYGSVETLLFDGPLTAPLFAMPVILTLGSFVFGLADDVFGSAADKGFRGHLTALSHGRLTTGGLKLLGIGLLAAVYGWSASRVHESAQDATLGVQLGWWIAATLVIALSANLMNLLDLRPGRALKSYSLLAVIAGVVFARSMAERFVAFYAESGVGWGANDLLVTTLALLVVLLGPVAAAWRFDLGERGMLGDAGSNAMGAIVGYLLAGALTLPWLAAVAVVLLGLNLLSERVSFSRVIEDTPVLRELDRLGRLPDEASAGD